MDASRGGPATRRVDLRRVDLNLLVSLHYLLEECQVTAAAARMSISQPSMSASLSRLRYLLDDPLMVRAGRKLVLTPLAQSLVEPVAEILRDIEQTLSARPTFDPRTDARQFIVATTDYITLVLLKKLVTELAFSTELHLEIQPVLASHVEDLRQGRIDLIIAPREVIGDLDDLVGVNLFKDRFIGMASAKNTDVDDLTVEKFSQLSYLAYRSDGARSNVDRQFDALGVALNVEMTTESFVVVPLLVAESNFISMIHERLGRVMADFVELRFFESPIPLSSITQTIYWHPRRSDDPGHRWLREKIIAEARSHR
ncbi:LysR family transcriptional regulator [Homoserinimonas sp. OAct 916]|uniref:LysR family transcriptional regulator n=1 Tax=Homoserinimonas sp. OAct 916 TaxID=2211450 RepID=UPI0018E54F17|nr:LysR family transcriptional regulator [Homoserinimonas sp. OAct 916]